MKRHTFLLIVATAALLLAGCSRGQQAAPPDALGLRQVAEVPLPGSTSRWDYASLDPSTGRLYLAHLGGSSVTVFDTKNQQVVTDITGIASAHGVIAVPQLKRVYATATGDNQVVAIDTQSLQILGRTIPTAWRTTPTTARYSSRTNRAAPSRWSAPIPTGASPLLTWAAKSATRNTTRWGSTSSPPCRRAINSSRSTRGAIKSRAAPISPVARTRTAC
jgi:hypothetical protein